MTPQVTPQYAESRQEQRLLSLMTPRGILQHPSSSQEQRLLSMMTPQENPQHQESCEEQRMFSMMTPQETPQQVTACREPRRDSPKQRCLELQLEQYEEDLRERGETLAQMEETLRQEAADKRMLEQRLLEQQRSLAAQYKEQEHRLLEERIARESENRRLEAEWLQFKIEKENMEEDRRNFLLHKVHEADAELIRREHELEDKRDRWGIEFEEEMGRRRTELEAEHMQHHRDLNEDIRQRREELDIDRSRLVEEQRRLTVERAKIAAATVDLEESLIALQVRETKVAEREHAYAETMERASQTPLFHSRSMRRSCCQRLLSAIRFGAKIFLLILLLIWAAAMFARVSPWWNYLQVHENNFLRYTGLDGSHGRAHKQRHEAGGAQRSHGHVSSFLQDYGFCPSCPPCARYSNCHGNAENARVSRDRNSSGGTFADLRTACPFPATSPAATHIDIGDSVVGKWTATSLGTALPIAYWLRAP
jgi:hypothetical protein